jgi:P27 family predicted phage terminase small subunit
MGGKGSGGHNRKSAEEHRRQGTYKPSRHGKFLLADKLLLAKIDPAMLQCPDWLDDIAKAEWNRVAPALYQMGLLTILDHAALEGYCVSYSMFVRAAREIGESFVYDFVEGKSLNLKRVKKPEASIARDSMNQIRLFCAEFGLTASSRGRMALPSEREKSPFEELLDYCNESTETDK